MIDIHYGNKLIAEFMKPTSYDKRRKDYPFPFPVIETVPAEKIMGYGSVPEGEIKHFSGQPNMMQYHKSWDWLIKVVEEIENYNVVASFNINNTTITIEGALEELPTLDDIEVEVAGSKLLAVWEAVVKFIEWYNKN